MPTPAIAGRFFVSAMTVGTRHTRMNATNEQFPRSLGGAYRARLGTPVMEAGTAGNGFSSERQRETLDFIRKYVNDHGVAPSRPEIANALGLTDKSTVDAHLSALMKKGWIELRPGSPRNIWLLPEHLPVIVADPIAAGDRS